MAHNDEFDELKVHNEPDEPEDVIRQMELDDLENIVDGWAADPHGHEAHTDVYLTADDINGDETVNTAPSPHNNDHHAEPYATQSSVDTLQTDIEGKADDAHDNSAHSENYATNPHGDGSHTEDYAVDGDAQPPEIHDNTAHTEDYITETSLAGVQTDIDAKADDPHDNAAHIEDYAVDGDAQPPEGHDNSAHTEDYATEADVAGKADAQGGRIGDETPLESIHTVDAESESVQTREVTFVGDPPTETTGLDYDEWSHYLDTATSGGSGPRLRAEIDGGVRITGATVDVVSAGDTEVALKEINDDGTHGATVDTHPISVTEGVSEVDLDIVVPGTGEEYALSVIDSNSVEFRIISSDSAGEDIPYPFQGDLLTIINNSHPAGYDAPSTSYQKYFNISVEAVESPQSSVGIKSGDSIDIPKVSTGTHNNTYYPKPGEFADAVHAAGPEDVIKLHAGRIYDPGGEIIIPNRVTIDCNDAIIQPSSDHNIFFLSPRCTVKNARIKTGDGYEFTSDVFLADTGRLGDSYHGSNRGIKIDAVCSNAGDHKSGTCFHVNVANSGEWFSVQQDISLKMSGFYDGIHMHVDSGGHANGNRIDAHIWGCGVNIRKSGGGNCSTRITGEMDGTDSGANGGTQYMFYQDNDSGRPITFQGYLWDSFNAAQEQIHGQINIIAHNRPHPTLLPESPNGSGLIWWLDSDEVGYADIQNQITYRMRFTSNWWRYEVDTDGGRNFRDMMSFRPLENTVRINGELMVGSLNEVG